MSQKEAGLGDRNLLARGAGFLAKATATVEHEIKQGQKEAHPWGVETCDVTSDLEFGVRSETNSTLVSGLVGGAIVAGGARVMGRRDAIGVAGAGGVATGVGMESAHAENNVEMRFTTLELTAHPEGGGESVPMKVDVYGYSTGRKGFAMCPAGTNPREKGFYISFGRFAPESQEQLRKFWLERVLEDHPEMRSKNKKFPVKILSRKGIPIQYAYHRATISERGFPQHVMHRNLRGMKPYPYDLADFAIGPQRDVVAKISQPEVDALMPIYEAEKARKEAEEQSEREKAGGRKPTPGFPATFEDFTIYRGAEKVTYPSVVLVNVWPSDPGKPIAEVYIVPDGQPPERGRWYPLHHPTPMSQSRELKLSGFAEYDRLMRHKLENAPAGNVRVGGYNRDFEILNRTKAFEGKTFVSTACTPDEVFAIEKGTHHVYTTRSEGPLQTPGGSPLKAQRLEVKGNDTMVVFSERGVMHSFSERGQMIASYVGELDSPLEREDHFALSQISVRTSGSTESESSGSDAGYSGETLPEGGAVPENFDLLDTGYFTLDGSGKLSHHWPNPEMIGDVQTFKDKNGEETVVDRSIFNSSPLNELTVYGMDTDDTGGGMFFTNHGLLTVSVKKTSHPTARRKCEFVVTNTPQEVVKKGNANGHSLMGGQFDYRRVVGIEGARGRITALDANGMKLVATTKYDDYHHDGQKPETLVQVWGNTSRLTVEDWTTTTVGAGGFATIMKNGRVMAVSEGLNAGGRKIMHEGEVALIRDVRPELAKRLELSYKGMSRYKDPQSVSMRSDSRSMQGGAIPGGAGKIVCLIEPNPAENTTMRDKEKKGDNTVAFVE